MKFRITLKDPDGVNNSLNDAAMESLPEGLDEEEREAILELRKEKIDGFASKWITWGEYVTLELDTDSGTAIVVVNKP